MKIDEFIKIFDVYVLGKIFGHMSIDELVKLSKVNTKTLIGVYRFLYAKVKQGGFGFSKLSTDEKIEWQAAFLEVAEAYLKLLEDKETEYKKIPIKDLDDLLK